MNDDNEKVDNGGGTGQGSNDQDSGRDTSGDKASKIFKEAEYHKPPDRDDAPPPPIPEGSHEEDK